VEALNSAPGGQKCLLHVFLRLRPVSGHQDRRAEEHVLVALHQMAEGFPLAVLTTQDRLLIRHSPPS